MQPCMTASIAPRCGGARAAASDGRYARSRKQRGVAGSRYLWIAYSQGVSEPEASTASEATMSSPRWRGRQASRLAGSSRVIGYPEGCCCWSSRSTSRVSLSRRRYEHDRFLFSLICTQSCGRVLGSARDGRIAMVMANGKWSRPNARREQT